MDKGPGPSEAPYVVVTTTGGIHSGHPTSTAAERTARIANESATKHGIETRYEVRTNEETAQAA